MNGRMNVHHQERRRISGLRDRNRSEKERLQTQMAWLVVSFLVVSWFAARLGVTVGILVLEVIVLITAQPVWNFLNKKYRAWTANLNRAARRADNQNN